MTKTELEKQALELLEETDELRRAEDASVSLSTSGGYYTGAWVQTWTYVAFEEDVPVDAVKEIPE